MPDGIGTAGHYLYIIEMDEDQQRVPIGYFWYSVSQDEGFAWLEEFCLFEQFRGQGYGGAVLSLAEAELADRGTRSMRLHVFGDNERALGFYRRHGFKVTGYNMKRDW